MRCCHQAYMGRGHVSAAADCDCLLTCVSSMQCAHLCVQDKKRRAGGGVLAVLTKLHLSPVSRPEGGLVRSATAAYTSQAALLLCPNACLPGTAAVCEHTNCTVNSAAPVLLPAGYLGHHPGHAVHAGLQHHPQPGLPAAHCGAHCWPGAMHNWAGVRKCNWGDATKCTCGSDGQMRCLHTQRWALLHIACPAGVPNCPLALAHAAATCTSTLHPPSAPLLPAPCRPTLRPCG